jgi:hypothetical protein
MVPRLTWLKGIHSQMCAYFRTDVLDNLTRDARLLAPHLIGIRQVKLYSEKVSSQLESLSSMERM